jgi:hypothetical protein
MNVIVPAEIINVRMKWLKIFKYLQQMKGKYAQACAFMMKIQIFIKYTKTMLKNIILG